MKWEKAAKEKQEKQGSPREKAAKGKQGKQGDAEPKTAVKKAAEG